MSNTPTTIRQLEWEYMILSINHSEEWLSVPVEGFLKYSVVKNKQDEHFNLYVNHTLTSTKFTLADAQYAAQADFEKKIRSCLL